MAENSDSHKRIGAKQKKQGHKRIGAKQKKQARLGAVVIMDSLNAHKLKALRQKIEAAGARLLHLSPYSPDINPIELTCSKLKSRLRRMAARTTAAPGRANVDLVLYQGRVCG